MPTATDVLGIFFSSHAREYPKITKIITNNAIQSMISFIMSKSGSNPEKPMSIYNENVQTKQGYIISLDRIESQTNGVYITFILFVKTNFRENMTEQNPGMYLDISFYCNSDNEWEWNMGLTKEAFSRKHGGSSKTQYDSIKKDANLTSLTDEGILHTFDLGLSVLSGTIVFHNNSHSCLKLFVLVVYKGAHHFWKYLLSEHKRSEELFDSTGTGFRVIHPKIKLDFSSNSNMGSFVSACKRVILNHIMSDVTKRNKTERIGLECLKQPKTLTKGKKFFLVGSLSLDNQK